MKTLQITVLALASIAFASSASAQTIYATEKIEQSSQTSNSAPTPITTPYLFQDVESPNYTYTTVTGPGGTNTISSVAGSGGTYKYQSSSYSTQAALDAAFPDSTPGSTSTYYTFNSGGPSTALAGDQYPAAPQLTLVGSSTPTWSGGDLILDPTVSNTFTWSAFSATNTEGYNYSTGGYIQFKLVGGSVNDRQTALGPDGQSAFNTYTVAANTLSAGSTYTLQINYFLADSGSSTSTFSAAGYEGDNIITVLAVPEPPSVVLLWVGVGILALGHVRSRLVASGFARRA